VSEIDPTQPKPLLVDIGHEIMIVYPGEETYKLLDAYPRDGDGIIHAEASLIEKIRGWWYPKAIEKAEKLAASLEIPWEQMKPSIKEIEDGSISGLTEKLSLTAAHIIRLSTVLAPLEAGLVARKETLDQAVHRKIAVTPENKQSITIRSADLIAGSKALKIAKIEIIEAQTQKVMLEKFLDALNIQWKTLSRIISARLAEPLE